MMHHVAGVAGALYRRAADNDTPTYDLPPWSIFVVLLDVVVFLPIILFMGYTLNHIYPTLAMIEDENPPAYEPLSLQDPTPDSEENGMPKPLSGSAAGAPRTITSSLRSVNRTLYATAGWRANFRGLGCLVAQGIASSFLYGIFSAVFPAALASVATLLTTLALIQFSTAWVHIVISAPQPKRFWHRLPSFRRAFDAAAKPAVAAWLAIEVTTWTSLLMAAALGLRRPHVGPGGHPEVPRHKAGDAGKAMAVFAVALVLQVLLVIPTQVVLVRVQASLLPPDEDTIVPFDRSFEGKVEPAVVGGKGYVGMKDAWATFSRGAWKRLVVMYVKIFVVSSALMALMAAVIVPEAIILAKHSQLKN